MRRFVGSTLMIAFLLLACDEKPAPALQTETPAAQPAAPPAPAATPIAAESAPSPAPSAVQTPAPKPTPAPTSAAKPAAASAPAPGPAPQAAAPAPAATPIPAPAPAPAPATPAGPMPSLANNGHAAAGSDKCRMCHRLQHDSWSVTAHAKKGLDCEGCHGNGADYKTMSVMKDLAAAKAAGLVLPGPGFCRKCHGAKVDASMLPRAHAHKA